MPILGMLGGLCGEPVSISLLDYPPDVLGALHRLIREHVPAKQVCEIFGPADVRRLVRRAASFAMVLVYPVPGHASAGLVTLWRLAMGRRTRMPMAILSGERCDQEPPGAILSLRAGPGDIARLRTALAGQPMPDGRVKEFLSRPRGAGLEISLAGLHALFGKEPDSLWAPRSLRAVQTLRGLLAGHSLLRRLVTGAADPGIVSPDLDDYAGVCGILKGSKAGLPGESGDPILAAMVRRANLYLKSRDAAPGGPGPIHAGRDGHSSVATSRSGGRGAYGKGPISLRELADLGNARSPMTRTLVDASLATRNPVEIQALGLRKKLPAETTPGSVSRSLIEPLLVEWSMKQVRKRFDRLRRQGFVDAERVPPGNGPWFIHLPGELRPLPGEFHGLPTVERVAEACRAAGSAVTPA